MKQLWALMEAPAFDPPSLRRRTTLLVAIHLALAAAAVAVLALIAWRIRLLVTLAQRSNVETLVIAFVVLFLLYVLVTTAPAIVGSLRVLYYRALPEERAQRALQRRIDRAQKETKRSYLNVAVRGPDGGDITIPLEDRYGRIGTCRLRLSEVAFEDAPEGLAHSPMQLVARTLTDVGTLDGTDHEPKVIFWDGIEEEQAQRYFSEVSAFARLERTLGKGALWPSCEVDARGLRELREQLHAAMPYLREATLIPDVEYQAEFAVPIVPEPFAFIQLRRTQQHADAVASMGCAAIVTIVFLAVIVLVVAFPPWVPGK